MEEGRLIGHIIAVGVGVILSLLPAKIQMVLSAIGLALTIVLLVLALVSGVEPLPFIGLVVGMLMIATFSALEFLNKLREQRERLTLTDSWADSWTEDGRLYWIEEEYTESGTLYHQYRWKPVKEKEEEEEEKEEDCFPPLLTPRPLPVPVIRPPSQPLCIREAWVELENKYRNDIE